MRISIVAVSFLSALACGDASAQWWNPLAPRDYEDCIAAAAKDTQNNKLAYNVLQQSCKRLFPGRRKRGGGYEYYHTPQRRWFDTKGPVPTTEETRFICAEHEIYSKEQEKEREENSKKLQLQGWGPAIDLGFAPVKDEICP